MFDVTRAMVTNMIRRRTTWTSGEGELIWVVQQANTRGDE